MKKIILLSDLVCNQIAAGEVIERPAAVVKELMENSVDAGSQRIYITLLQGGRKEIRVVDDGEGMDQEDALLALERHATSKIRNVEDLQSIQTLGFRGEALPSIAAVSRFELVTREQGAVAGTQIVVESGVLKGVRETGCPAGTAITVRDLFLNVPARRKFLRSVDTEMAHVSDQFLRLSMAHPEIHFQLSHQGRRLFDFPRTRDHLERAGQILGVEMVEALHPFTADSPPLRLKGLVSPPELQKTSQSATFIYINGRPVQERSLNRSVLAAYESLLPKGRYPVVVLFIEIPPELVDVNTHPTKREVRFRSPGQVFEAIRSSVKDAVDEVQKKRWQKRLVPPRESHSSSAGGETREFQDPLDRIPRSVPPPGEFARPRQIGGLPFSASPTADALQDAPAAGAEAGEPLFSRLSFLGQLANAYILLEAPDGLVLIDQHAAHERVIFDRLAASPSRNASQRLLQPAVVDLFPKEAAMVRGWLQYLRDIGFEIEPFGGDSFAVHAVPAVLGAVPPGVLLRELVESNLEEQKTPEVSVLSTLAKTAACHSAIRAGQKLQREEIRGLLEDLDRTPASATCPHGRPLWWKLTYRDIARFFHRA